MWTPPQYLKAVASGPLISCGTLPHLRWAIAMGSGTPLVHYIYLGQRDMVPCG